MEKIRRFVALEFVKTCDEIVKDSEPMDYHDSNAYFTQQLTAQNPYSQNPRRGTMASQNGLSDLDSGPASLPIMPMSVASNHSSSSKPRQPPAKFKLDLPNSRPTTPAGTYLVSISLFLSPQMTFFPILLCTIVHMYYLKSTISNS